MEPRNGMDEVMFTSASVLDLLLQIEELQDYSIGMNETLDGQLQLQVGDSVYTINNSNCTTVEVDDWVVGQIDKTTDEAYQDIVDQTMDISDLPQYEEEIDTIEGSFIKEIAKSLTLGGLIRFAGKHLLK